MCTDRGAFTFPDPTAPNISTSSPSSTWNVTLLSVSRAVSLFHFAQTDDIANTVESGRDPVSEIASLGLTV